MQKFHYDDAILNDEIVDEREKSIHRSFRRKQRHADRMQFVTIRAIDFLIIIDEIVENVNVNDSTHRRIIHVDVENDRNHDVKTERVLISCNVHVDSFDDE